MTPLICNAARTRPACSFTQQYHHQQQQYIELPVVHCLKLVKWVQMCTTLLLFWAIWAIIFTSINYTSLLCTNVYNAPPLLGDNLYIYQLYMVIVYKCVQCLLFWTSFLYQLCMTYCCATYAHCFSHANANDSDL